jgi:hypothetical protein
MHFIVRIVPAKSVTLLGINTHRDAENSQKTKNQNSKLVYLSFSENLGENKERITGVLENSIGLAR